MRTQPPFPKRRRSPQFSAHVYCGQMAGWIKIALGMEVGLGPAHIVLHGDTASLHNKGGRARPQFSAHLYCGQMAGCIKMPLGMKVRLSQCDFMLDGDPALYPKRGAAPLNFRHMSMWPTAAWIKMPPGTEVGLDLREIVFDVDPATPEKRAHPPHPIFGPCRLWPNAWIDEDAAWYGSRPRPRPHRIKRGPSSCERGTAARLFLSPCLLWSRMPISATAELLLIKSQQDLSEEMQFYGFLFPQVVQKYKLSTVGK